MRNLLDGEKINKIEELMKKFALKHSYELNKLGMQVEDFVQDIFVNLLRRCKNTVFDIKKVTSFNAFCNMVAKRHLIDLRKHKVTKSREGHTHSLDNSIDNLETDFGGNIEDTDARFGIMLFEAIESIPETQISSNYLLTWRQLFELSLKESSLQIADNLGISENRVNTLQRKLHKMISSTEKEELIV